MPRAFASAGLQHVGTRPAAPVGPRLHRRRQADRHPRPKRPWSGRSRRSAPPRWPRCATPASPGKIFLDAGAGADETLSGPNGRAMEGTYIVHSGRAGRAPLMATTPSGTGRARLHLPLHPAIRGLQRLRALRRRRAEPGGARRPARRQPRPAAAARKAGSRCGGGHRGRLRVPAHLARRPGAGRAGALHAAKGGAWVRLRLTPEPCHTRTMSSAPTTGRQVRVKRPTDVQQERLRLRGPRPYNGRLLPADGASKARTPPAR